MKDIALHGFVPHSGNRILPFGILLFNFRPGPIHARNIMGNQVKSLDLWSNSVCNYFLKMQKTEARSLINNNYNILISNKFAMHIRVVTQILVDFDFVQQELNFSVETPFNQI